MRRRWLAVLTALLLVSGCSPDVLSMTSPSPVATVGPGEIRPMPSAATAVSSPSATEDLVQNAIDAMTLDQKIGQLLMVALNRGTPASSLNALISDGQVTGVMLLGNGWTMAEAKQTIDLLDTQSVGQSVGLYLAADQEGGKVQRLSGTGFDTIPAATVQGTWTPQKLTGQATTWAKQMHDAGINLNLAPVADTVPASMVSANQPIGMLDRQFSSDPAVVGTQAAAFVTGMNAGGIQTCIKHFPGLGRITGNTDVTKTGTTDSITTVDDPYIESFKQAVAAGPAMVMVSSATYSKIDPKTPAMFSSVVITQVLRGDLGWQGVVITDSLDAAAVSAWTPGQRAIDFIAAGGDIALFTSIKDAQAAAASLKAKANSDPAFASQIDVAVRRILTAKQSGGLLPKS